MTVPLKHWTPEDAHFWQQTGKRIALRNLVLSTVSLHLNFVVWMMWSIVVVNLQSVGFALTSEQQFWLVALPPLSGAVMRVVYSMAWSWVGSGRWLAWSTWFLLLPAWGVGYAVRDVTTPYWQLVLVSICCGIGGGASASHLTSTSFFFPQSRKGLSMGLNAAFGNLGVSAAQLLIPLAIGYELFGWLGGEPQIWGYGNDLRVLWLQNAGYIWLPFILLTGIACWIFAHDLPNMRLTPADQIDVMRYRHNWYIGLLYMGTYGTFIGFSATFPLLAGGLFPAYNVAHYAFIGPMVGALSRSLGGWLGDRFGGGISTCLGYLLMIIATLGICFSLPAGGSDHGNFSLFFGMFTLAFFAAGLGNGAAYLLAPKVFMMQARQQFPDDPDAAYKLGGRHGAAAMGVSAVVASIGGFIIPKSIGSALDISGSAGPALLAFCVFYLVGLVVAWWQYTRSAAPMRC